MVWASILSLALLGYTGGFREGDWVNYSDFRFINGAAQDQTTVYFATTNGVIRYDRFAQRWLDPMTITDGLPDHQINNIAYDASYDRLYVNTALGIAYYQPTFQQWYAGIDFPTTAVRNDFRASAMGMLTTEFGYTYQNGFLTDMFFHSYQLTRGVDDGFNHLFVGTWGNGTVLINPRYGELQRLPFGLYTEDATALIRVGDKFWIGGGPGEGIEPGVTMCDTSLQTWNWYMQSSTKGLASTHITCAVADGGTTWLGSDFGLMRYNNADNYFTTIPNFVPFPTTTVTALAADSAWIYIGTDNGLGFLRRTYQEKHKKNNDSNQVVSQNDSTKSDSTKQGLPLLGKNRLLGWYIYSLKVLNNYLYVGTNRGALRRQLGTNGDLSIVNTPDNLLSTDILDFAQSGDSLFFATNSDIIYVNATSGQSVSLTKLSHFGQWQIRKIAVDGKHVWAATGTGLWMYRLSDGYERLFTTSDGMISSDVRSLELVGDYLWLATPNGVIRFLWNRPSRVD
jgi:ligand-binding sensor domain-containing protein